MIKSIQLVNIRIDGNTQQRDIDDDVVSEYQSLIAENPEAFPPISVVFDGKYYWVFDGFHRYHAYLKLGKKMISAEVTNGTQREAILMSCAANKGRGFSRQKGTVRHILVEVMFPDKEWGGPKYTDEAVAKWVGCSRQTVIKHRKAYAKIEQRRLHNTDNVNADNISTDESTKDSEPENEDSPPIIEPILDAVGRDVPEHLREIFERIPEITEDIKQLNAMFRRIKEAHIKNDPLYANCRIEALKAEVGNVRRILRFTLPYSVCGYCGGDVNNAECRACGGRGFVTESVYMATPEDMR